MTSRSRTGLAFAVALAAAAGCRGSGPVEVRPSAGPQATAVASGPEDLVPAADAASAARALEAGMPALVVVLDDPRLAAARGADAGVAAGVVEGAIASAGLDAVTAAAWWYVAGRLRAQAGASAEAAADFGRCLAADAPVDAGAAGGGDTRAGALAPYAALREAEALVHLGKGPEALAAVSAIGDDLAARDEVKLATADALVVSGSRAKAMPLWRGLLASSPHGLRWADTALQLATALLDGLDGPGDAAFHEALDLTTRVLVEAPAVAEKADVPAMRERAARSQAGAPQLTPDDRARQAQAWLDAGQPKRASDAANALLAHLPAAAPKLRTAGCQAATVRAQAVPHGKSGAAADAWGDAIKRCEGGDGLPPALYYGAKASVSAHRADEALARFGRLEHEFPAHHLADDARLRSAQVVEDQGDAARAIAMLTTLPDAYPAGDMRGEALFRAAIEQLGARDLGGARATLDRLLALPPDDPKASNGGRGAYFRARVAELSGEAADAKARYAAVLEAQPLTIYMAMAYARLHALDEPAARAAIHDAVAREPEGPFLTQAHPELATPSFARFLRLLEVGDLEAARREASAGKLVAEGVDPEVVWTVAWAYDRAGAPDVGHSFARSRLTDFRAHWPSGRWRLPWRAAYPRAWDGIVARESTASGIPAPLVWSIMREESAYNPDAKSAASAVGLMQLLLGTARQMAAGTPLSVDEDALRRPEVSIALGARLLSKMRGSFASNPSLAIAAYNCGSGPVRRWLAERGGDDFDLFVERIPYEETRNYIKRVLTSEVAYAYLYAPEALDELLALPVRAAGGT